MIHHITWATRHFVFWSLIAVAISLSGVRLLLYGIEYYKTNLEEHISQLIGAPVSIGRLGAKIRGFDPEIVLKDINISSVESDKKPVIKLEQIRIGIHLIDAFTSHQWLASSWITLVGAKISVNRKPDGRFSIVGLKASQDGQPLWLLKGKKYEVLNSEITWHDEKRQGKPVVFDVVDLAILNVAGQHRLNVLARLPKKYGDMLRISAEFSGDIFNANSIQGRIYIEGKQLKLAKLITGALPLSVHIDTGIGDFNVWGQIERSRLVTVQGDVQLRDLKLHRDGKGDFLAKRLQTPFYWGIVNDKWQFITDNLVLQTQDNQYSKSTSVLNLSGDWTVATLNRVDFFSDQLALQTISKALQVFAPLSEACYQSIVSLQVKGHLEKIELRANVPENVFSINSKVVNASVASLNSPMAVENISGHINGNDKQGTLNLSTDNAHFIAPQLFKDALSINRLTGTIRWLQNQEQWLLSSGMLILDTPAIKSKNRMQLVFSKTNEPLFLDIQSSFTGDDITQVKHYLPVGIMKESVVNWLDNAFVKGRVPQGGFLFYGKASDFPFVSGKGVFEVLFNVDQLSLLYHPQWPLMNDINADVLFSQNSLHVALHEGQTQQLKINQAKISIPKLGISPRVLINGSLEGDIAQVLGFMQKTPLTRQVDAVLAQITPVGHTQIAMDLKIPLNADVAANIKGTATLNDAKLTINSLGLPVKAIKGAIKFNERGIYGNAINAVALNYPIGISIEQAPQQTVINVAGRINLDDMQKSYSSLWWEKLTGATDYKLKLDLPDSGTPLLNIASDLEGIALNFPGMLAKTEMQKKPLSVLFKLNNKEILPITVNYDDQLQADLNVDIKGKKLLSGAIAIGGEDSVPIEGAGITVDINRDRLLLQDWLALTAMNTANVDDKTTQTNCAVKSIKLRTRHGIWQDIDLGFFDLFLKSEGTDWTGILDSDTAKGQFRIPNNLKGTEQIHINMDMIDFSVLKQEKTASLTAAVSKSAILETVPETMPIVSVTSKMTMWQGVNLGRMNVETERKPDGVTVKRMELVSNDQTLTLTGGWNITGKQSQTSLQGHWYVPRAGMFFNQIGLSHDFSETQANVDFILNWQAAPQQFAWSKLKGQIDIHLSKGRILTIDPGFGRMLGVLALEQWIKRLQLDFSDVYKEGLMFNHIDGHFDVINGKMMTKNLIIDAIPATIRVMGETDLIKKTVNYTVSVVPKSTDAVPIAGTIVSRITAQVMKSLTGKELDGFLFESQYQIEGAWGDAKMSRVYKNDGLLQKTWHGITDFSWMRN